MSELKDLMPDDVFFTPLTRFQVQKAVELVDWMFERPRPQPVNLIDEFGIPDDAADMPPRKVGAPQQKVIKLDKPLQPSPETSIFNRI